MTFRDYITIIRPLNCVMMFVAVFIGTMIESGDFIIIGTIAGLVAFLVGAGGNVINDYFDIEIDKINAPKRPLAAGKIQKNVGLAYSAVLFSVGIVISFLINYICLIIASINSVLLILYAKNLKKTEFIGNISVAYLMSSLFVFGGAAVGSINVVIFLALCAFFAGIGREVAKDIADIEGDRKNLATTLPIKRGEDFAAKIAIVSILIAIIISPIPYILGYLNILYVICVLIADLGFFLCCIGLYKDNSSKNAEKIELHLKLNMLITLIAFVIGTI